MFGLGVFELTVLWAIALAMVAFTVVGTWKVLGKMGCKPWAAVIPFYATWELGKGATTVAWIAPFTVAAQVIYFVIGVVDEFVAMPTMAMSLLSTCYLVAMAALFINLSRAFGHGIGFMMGLVFLTPIFMMILGFSSKARFLGATTEYGVTPNPEADALIKSQMG